MGEGVDVFQDMCKNGNYCLFESSGLFEGFVSEEYILFSTCQEIVAVCQLYPNSAECAQSTCSNGYKDGTETDVDCGGICPPCDDGGNSGGDDCFFPCLDGVEECVDGECLTICNDDNPCFLTGFECIGGYCIEVEGECESDDDCPDGYVCSEGYCIEFDGEGGCENPCEILTIFPNPASQIAVTTVIICINSGGFPELLVYDNEDLIGDPIYSQIYEYLEPGEHELIIPAGELFLGNSFFIFENDGCTSNIKPHIVIAFQNNDTESESRGFGEIPSFDANEEVLFLVYPNPNRGIFTIENISGEFIEGFHLYDINGRKINLSVTNSNKKIEIELEKVLNGVYILEILTGTSSHYQKVIVR